MAHCKTAADSLVQLRNGPALAPVAGIANVKMRWSPEPP
jgi:hypothetical protein